MDNAQLEVFECSLRRQHRNRRLILGGIAVLGILIFITFYALYEASAQVVQVFPWPVPYERVEYDQRYMPFAAISFGIGLTSAFLLLFDFAYCRFRSVAKGDQIITVNRRAFSVRVYVDGKEVARRATNITAVADVWLNNRVRATVCISRSVWYLAHISYSDLSTSVEI